MITVHEVSMNFGPQVLFENVSVVFNEGERYGLTGPNGSGKSTFMKIVTGDLEPTSGRVRRPKKFGVLRQDHYAYEDVRVIDVVLMGNAPLWEAMTAKEALLAKGDDLDDDDGMRLGELEMTIAEEDGYMAEPEAEELLEGLGIEAKFHNQPLSSLTGGDKVRVLLAQALFGKPEALLLDEPTNTLDIASIRWLEGFLADYTGALVVISHDRHFLNEVCTRIADIDYETVIVYPGNYDDMVEMKAQARSSLEMDNEAKQRRISQLKDFVQRFRAGSRASQVKSREKALERERKAMADLKRSNIKRPFMRFDVARPSGKQVLNVDALDKQFEHARICEHFHLNVFRGDRIAFVGRNGIGKTSMMRLFMNELRPDDGEINWGYETQIGYMPQDHSEVIEKSDVTAHEWLWQWNVEANEEHLRGLFGRLLFTKDEPFKPTKVLSGGETVRLLLARLMITQPNVLVLDEPTNHLDLEAIRSLTEALALYEGTLLFVTHDRQMISRVATRILEMTETGVRELSPEQFTEGQFLMNRRQYRKGGGDW
ncbi:ATP-binding cassette domain-containing protein [Myxococcota bacterium]|nr:ATP-binding cassette domain-containing protein [Myxococcota bacterium]MBU1431741.1 ATP-binding cassette domain-containing protein [Myxococcota bacterium]MBU1900375.1 ATP-binding cassette domain-containing protein [Myxococcota bacterium]